MRLVPLATIIFFATDVVLTRVPHPTLVACGCAVFGMGWVTYRALNSAAERDSG
jgi:hypothetical protein